MDAGAGSQTSARTNRRAGAGANLEEQGQKQKELRVRREVRHVLFERLAQVRNRALPNAPQKAETSIMNSLRRKIEGAAGGLQD
jgi:hypothetical protein